MSLKTENSRRVAKSRPVCMGLKAHVNKDEIVFINLRKILYEEKWILITQTNLRAMVLEAVDRVIAKI